MTSEFMKKTYKAISEVSQSDEPLAEEDFESAVQALKEQCPESLIGGEFLWEAMAFAFMERDSTDGLPDPMFQPMFSITKKNGEVVEWPDALVIKAETIACLLDGSRSDCRSSRPS